MIQRNLFSFNDHVNNLISSPYFKNLILLRSVVEKACSEYFQSLNAPKVDLYLISKGVSSPMGKGSDSLPIPFRLGSENVFLVDSAQFGMEPLVLSQYEIVYCYLPSFRGEDADDEHLNQFFHCEAEIRGGYERSIQIAEGLFKFLISAIVSLNENGVVQFENDNLEKIGSVSECDFPIIPFDDVCDTFAKLGYSALIETCGYGRVLTRNGEIKVAELFGNNSSPVWVSKYDRDVVPFYQKPDPENIHRVLNADLILPSINGGFGGEVIGLGQRQDNVDELLESMQRQSIENTDAYEWYIKLRQHPKYTTTSGFGLGIERFLAWALGSRAITDVAIYPVIKNSIT